MMNKEAEGTPIHGRSAHDRPGAKDDITPNVGDELIIMQTGTLTGSFSNVINPGDYKFDVGYFRNEGFVKLTVASVPEPSSVILMTGSRFSRTSAPTT